MIHASGVILAAGRAERFGQDKMLVELGGSPLLLHSVRAFVASGAVQELIVVARPGEETRLASLLEGVALPLRVVRGGARRRDSSQAGVEEAQGEYVLVHDAARPFVSPELINRVLGAAERFGAAAPVIPVTDTLRYVEANFLKPTFIPREGLVAMQTPQGFRRSLILAALALCQDDLPDDAAAILAAEEPVATVPGDPRNLKITHPQDLAFAARFLGRGDWI